MAKITEKQMQALREYAEGREHPDYDDFIEAGSLAFRNRERVIEALERRGLISEGIITQAGLDLVEGRQVNTDEMTEAQFARFAA